MPQNVHTAPHKNRKKNRSLISILLVLAILLFSCYAIWQAVTNLGRIKTADKPLSKETEAELEALSQTIEEIRQILEHSEAYPASLLQLLAGNLEAMEFVKQYPEHGLDTPADTVGSVNKGEIPLLLQWDTRWGYTTYGSDFLAVTGCGPTCLSMVASGLTGDDSLTPVVAAEAAEQGGHYAEGYGSSWTIMSECSKEFGLLPTELPLDKNVMLQALAAGKPIVCSMNAGDFTSSGHYIVIVGEENGQFRVHDPNSPERSSRLWDYDRISSQIGNLWSFEAA